MPRKSYEPGLVRNEWCRVSGLSYELYAADTGWVLNSFLFSFLVFFPCLQNWIMECPACTKGWCVGDIAWIQRWMLMCFPGCFHMCFPLDWYFRLHQKWWCGVHGDIQDSGNGGFSEKVFIEVRSQRASVYTMSLTLLPVHFKASSQWHKAFWWYVKNFLKKILILISEKR